MASRLSAVLLGVLLAAASQSLLTQATAPEAARQTPQRFEQRVVHELALDYLLYLPEGYSDDGPPSPLVLFLHGAGERGSDLEKVATHGPPKMIAQGESIPAVVVSPQCPAETWWTDHLEALSLLLDEVIERYNVDQDRVYLTGLSMGGYGTWALAARQPERFAAAAPICGGGYRALAFRLAELPIWAFHGDADPVVPVAESRDLVEAIERRGGKQARLTTYPGVGHDSWTQTYADPKLWEWLFSQRRD